MRVSIGRVTRPRGLRGELKVDVVHEIPARIFIDDKEYKVTKSSGGYMFLDGICTPEQAECLRNKTIEANRADIHLSDDEVLASDLIGFDVVDTNGKFLGVLQTIENYGAGDIFDCGGFSFPNEDAFVVETNMTERKIVVNWEKLQYAD